MPWLGQQRSLGWRFYEPKMVGLPSTLGLFRVILVAAGVMNCNFWAIVSQCGVIVACHRPSAPLLSHHRVWMFQYLLGHTSSNQKRALHQQNVITQHGSSMVIYHVRSAE